jgi:DNA-binding CsgD family transcriptional regulator
MDENVASPDPTDTLIARLYRNALAVPPDQFRAWALEQVAQVIPCDGALWGSGLASHMRFHTVTVRGLPAEFPQRLQATVPVNPLPARILSQLGRPVDMQDVLPDEQFHDSEIYRRVFGPFGIERILATGHRDDRSGLYSLVTLYRRDAQARFTEIEKRRQQHVTYHLFNAASHSFFLHLLRHTDRVVGRGAAVIDAHGLFHEAQPRFFDLLEEHYPEHRVRESGLPFPLPAAGDSVTRGKLCVRCEALGDLYMVQIWKAGPLDRLTAREREIVMAVSQGLSFKQAARKIGVAPSTVANHLYRVYRKLGVSSRTELATVVHPGA